MTDDFIEEAGSNLVLLGGAIFALICFAMMGRDLLLTVVSNQTTATLAGTQSFAYCGKGSGHSSCNYARYTFTVDHTTYDTGWYPSSTAPLPSVGVRYFPLAPSLYKVSGEIYAITPPPGKTAP